MSMNKEVNKEIEFKIKALNKFVLEKKTLKVNSIIITLSLPDAVEFIEKWEISTIISLFEILDPKKASEIMYDLHAKQVTKLIQNLSLGELKKIFDELYIDEIVNLLENQTKSISKKVYSILSEKSIQKITSYNKFDRNTAGYNMTIEYIKIYDDIDVKTAMSDIKEQVSKDDYEIAGYIFVVDSNNNLKGLLRPEKLIASSQYEMINNIIDETPFVYSKDSLNKVKKVVEQHEQSFVPVLSNNDKLIGVIGAEDFISSTISISGDNTSDDSVSRSSKPYSQQTSIDLFRNRIFWIILLLVIGSFTQMMIIGFQLIWQSQGLWNYNAGFDVGVSSLITLGFATSLSVASSINDASGNAGSQASSTLIRSIATKEVDESMYSKIIRKEIFAGLIIGITVAIVSLFRMWAIWGIMGQYSNIESMFDFYWYFIISLIASISFFSAILIGNFVGAILPIIAAKFGKDATLFSGPLQTTIVDIITFLVYLSLTTLVFVLAADYINSRDPDVISQSFQNITLTFG